MEPKWQVGPMEKQISPPMQNVITVYRNGNLIHIYVCTSIFERPTKADVKSVTEIAQLIADKMNFG